MRFARILGALGVTAVLAAASVGQASAQDDAMMHHMHHRMMEHRMHHRMMMHRMHHRMMEHRMHHRMMMHHMRHDM